MPKARKETTQAVKKKSVKRASRSKDDLPVLHQYESSRGPFMLHSRYSAGVHLPEFCYTSKPVNIDDPKAVGKLYKSIGSYLGRLRRRSAAGSHLKRRGRKWAYKNRIAWMMMHDRAGQYTWIDVYRKVRIVRDQKSRRKLQTTFAVARMRHLAEYPDCSACRTFKKTISDRRRKLAA